MSEFDSRERRAIRLEVAKPWLALIVIGLLCFGCQVGTYDNNRNGILEENEVGVANKAADVAIVARDAGVPFGGLAAGIFGMIATIGTYLRGRSRNNSDKMKTVVLLDKIKDEIKDLSTDADVEKIILKYATQDTPFGRALKKAHTAVKRL